MAGSIQLRQCGGCLTIHERHNFSKHAKTCRRYRDSEQNRGAPHGVGDGKWMAPDTGLGFRAPDKEAMRQEMNEQGGDAFDEHVYEVLRLCAGLEAPFHKEALDDMENIFKGLIGEATELPPGPQGERRQALACLSLRHAI